MNHTPTPFEVKYIGRNVYIEPQGRKGFIADLQYTDCQSEEEMGEALANAAFIVRACNAHEELVKIAQAYRNHLKVFAHTEGEMATYQHINNLLTTIEKGV